jgi:hypothetical protein
MQDTSPDLLQRHDVFELRLRLEWMFLRETYLSEKMWGLQLELNGVTECAGRRLDQAHSIITGRLDTHPPLQIELHLITVQVDDFAIHRLTRYNFK